MVSHSNPDLMSGVPVNLHSTELQVCYTRGQSPTIVFIHGGLGNRFAWRSQWEFMRLHGRAALAYDLAGHGQSGRYRRYSIGRYRRDLTRLLKRFQIHAPILCCHSYGVPIGIEWAARHRATALVLIGGGTHNLTPWWEVPIVKFLQAGGYQLHRHPQIQDWLQALTSQNSTETVHRFIQENPIPQDPHAYQAMESFWGYDGRLSGVSCPVVVMTGENDPVFPPAMGRALAIHFSRSGQPSWHVPVPGAGHLVMAEAPELVNRVILEISELATR